MLGKSTTPRLYGDAGHKYVHCLAPPQTTFAINGTRSAQAMLSPMAAVGRIDSKAVTSSRGDRPQSYGSGGLGIPKYRYLQ